MSFAEFLLILVIIWLLYLLDQERKLNGRPGIPVFGDLFDSTPTVGKHSSPITTTEEHPPFNAEELQELEKAKYKKSPPPEKPEGEIKSSDSARNLSTRTNSVIGVNKSKPEDNNNAKKLSFTPLAHSTPLPAATKKNDDSSRQTRQSLYLPAPGEKSPDTPPPVRTPTTSTYLPVAGENPMLNDSNYQLRSTASSASLSGISANSDSSASVEGDKNPDDLVFAPTKKLVFNGPYDYQAISYHMTVKNNSRKWIAYAIKSNAIPRVTAMPPSGILKPGDKHTVAVTVQKFSYDEIDVSKDRIAFDYLFCPADTKVFTHSLLQGTATRRRKNIKIEYNP